MKFAKSDVEGRETRLILNSFRIDQEAAIVLCFEQLIVIAIGIGCVVEEDNSQSPP